MVAGKFEAIVKICTKAHNAQFNVNDCKSKVFLGKTTAIKLEVLRFGCDISFVSDDIFSEFSKSWWGIGKLKNYKLKLHINDKIKTVAQPMLRILYNLRNDVEK